MIRRAVTATAFAVLIEPPCFKITNIAAPYPDVISQILSSSLIKAAAAHSPRMALRSGTAALYASKNRFGYFALYSLRLRGNKDDGNRNHGLTIRLPAM